jgi:hypothetical protein
MDFAMIAAVYPLTNLIEKALMIRCGNPATKRSQCNHDCSEFEEQFHEDNLPQRTQSSYFYLLYASTVNVPPAKKKAMSQKLIASADIKQS